MRKVIMLCLLLAAPFFFQFCSSTKKAVAPVALTYNSNVLPMIQVSCSPCHIAGKGNKTALDNYTNASKYANDILVRIRKNPGEHGFMPMRNTKLSDSTIAVFAAWKQTGLLEK